MIRLITSSNQGFLVERPFVARDTERYSGLPLIKIDESKKCQDILGFGIALTEASCYTVSRLPESKRTALLMDIFSSSGLGLGVARLCVGASDYSLGCYSYNDVPGDLELRHFSIDRDRKNVLPIVKQVRELNPDLFLFTSVWSAPGWMKTGGSMCGGWLRHDYLETYAKYYIKYLLEYEKEGIHIDALTPQNECETDQCSRMPASFLHPEFEMELVRDHLRPLLDQNGLGTKIWLLDHNYIHWNRAKWMLEDEGVKRAAAGVAFHYYEGGAEMLRLLRQAHPDVEFHWTEGGPDLGESYQTDWCKWGQVFAEALVNGCRSVTGWNLALDEKGEPNIGPFSCAGLVTVDSRTNELSYSGQYRAFAHFSRYVHRGARRVCSDGCVNGGCDHSGVNDRLYHAVFENPDGELVAVLTNPSQRQDIMLEAGSQLLRLSLPEDSISTILLEPED